MLAGHNTCGDLAVPMCLHSHSPLCSAVRNRMMRLRRELLLRLQLVRHREHAISPL